MPIVNIFKGTKKVIFSFTTPRTSNIIVDNNFSNTLELFNKHNTIQLEFYIKKNFVLNDNVDNILKHFPEVEAERHKFEKIVFKVDEKNLDITKPLYDQIKKNTNISIGYERVQGCCDLYCIEKKRRME